MKKKSNKELKHQLSQQKTDFFLLKELAFIQKSLFSPDKYLWIDQNIQNQANQLTLSLLKENHINPILCQTIKEAQETIKKYPKDKFRIISSASMGETTCNQFHSHNSVIHIYIFCGYKPAGQALQQKWSKIKFSTVDVKQFLVKIKEQSTCDNRFSQLPTFMKITTLDNTHDNTLINKSRYNLHGLFLFSNRLQAKNDFLKIAQYFYSNNKSQLQQFQKDYPTQYNHAKSLNWYTKETFFYKLLNNFLRSSSNPLQTPYLRLPFDATFKAIKQIYDQGKENKKMMVYRGGFINDQQLKFLEKNVGQYIEMFGFMSTSTQIDVANKFIKNYKGNTLITVIIEDEQRQNKMDYGYANLVNYSQFGEDQVLFNALNVFKIVSYTKQDGIHNITLKYGQLARIGKLGQQKLQQKQKNILINYKHQQQIISSFIHQGDVLAQCQMYQSEIEYRSKYMNEKKELQGRELANQLFKMGLVYEKKTECNKALEYYQKTLTIMKNKFWESNLTISVLRNIGNIYKIKSQYNKALQYYQKSLKINIILLGENDKSTADTLINIASIYYLKDQNDKALYYYQKVLKINPNIQRDNNNVTALILNNIGNIYINKDNHNKALQYYQKSLKIIIIVYGENHIMTADLLNNIGIIYVRKEDYNKALLNYQKSLKITRNILGQNHTNIADTLNNIGLVYQKKAEYIKALQYYERSLKIKMNLLGENHSTVAETFKNIGIVYMNKADYKKALQYYEKALKIYMNILGENHSSTANLLQNIGIVYYERADYNKALQFYERSLKIYKNVLGYNHSSTANLIYNIGLVYAKQQRFSIALSYFQRCYELRKKIFGKEHKLTFEALENITICGMKANQ